MFVFWRIFPTSVFFKWLHLFLRLLSFLFLALFVSIIFYPCEGIGIFLSIYSIISLYQCIKSFIYISIITWFVIQYYLICCSNFSSFGSWELFQFSPVFLPLLILFVCVCVCVCVCVFVVVFCIFFTIRCSRLIFEIILVPRSAFLQGTLASFIWRILSETKIWEQHNIKNWFKTNFREKC